MSLFRAYDIRGVYDKDLTEEVAEKIGKAFGTVIGSGTVSVGCDVRLSSPTLKDALIRGILSAGVNVEDVGTVSTPLLYFSIYHYGLDGGAMITGSHNPPEYNGFKLCKGKNALYGEQIQELRKIIERGKYRKCKGKLKQRDVEGDYLEYVGERIKPGKKLKVVIDAGNGTASITAPTLFRTLGCEVIELYCKPDGNFPNHHPDPTVDGNLGDLIAKVRKENADLGVAYDGDGDRAGFVDDRGSIVRGDQAMIVFSKDILSRHKKAKIIFEVKCSKALPEEIEKAGGVPIMYRTGHSFIKKKIRSEKALLAGEMSGHFFFADNYYGYDDAIFASARMAEILSKSGESFSDMVERMPHYYSTPEIRVDCPDDLKFDIVEEVTREFQKDHNVITVDGARINFKGGWGLIRASNTQPALILRFEADTPEKLEKIRKTVEDTLSAALKKRGRT
ncbi:MAG: phosphomannomutase/phosphoglucomutase [Candidatus Altiarchaeota archaeon]